MTRRLAVLLAPALLLFGMAATGAGQEVIDSIEVPGAWVGSLAYNSTADVVYGITWSGGRVFAIACDSNVVVSSVALSNPFILAYNPVENRTYCSFSGAEEMCRGSVCGSEVTVVFKCSRNHVTVLVIDFHHTVLMLGSPGNRLHRPGEHRLHQSQKIRQRT